MPRIKRLKTEEPSFDFLDFDEAEQLIEAAAVEPEWQRLIIVALNTGMRRGELLALRWENVDPRARKLVVRRSTTRNVETAPKNWKSRTIPLNDRALEALRAHRHLRDPLVFCREDGSAIADHQVRLVLRRTCKRAGLRMIGAHTMRHSFASHLAIRGASIKVIQELLGHSDIKVTMRYAHLSPAARGHAVELLGPSKSTLTAQADQGPQGR